MNDKKVIIDLGPQGKIMFKSQLFHNAEEVNLDDLLRIDVANLHLEIVTFPVILNHVGLLLADATERTTRKKLDIEILEAKLADQYRSEAVEAGQKPLSNERVSEKVIQSPKYKVEKLIYLKYVKEEEYIKSLYWSLKSKDDKLNKISTNIQSGDIEQTLIETRLRRYNYTDIVPIIPKFNNK